MCRFHSVMRARAFTLIELLVAIAVLSLMVVLMAQMLRSTSDSWLTGKARANSFSKARSMLDLLARDLQGGVFRDDLASFSGVVASSSHTNVAFYTRRSGVPAAPNTPLRNVSLVQYSLNANGMLRRGDSPIAWNSPATDVSFGTTNALPQLASITDRDTVSGVVGFQLLFVQSDGLLSGVYDPTNRPKGVAIGLAFIDDNLLKKLTPGQLNVLQTAFANHLTGAKSMKDEWDSFLASGGLDWSSYPADMGRSLKIFERYVLLP